MNVAFAENKQAELSTRLIAAIQDPEQWAQVLDWIIANTGAKAAIITLRDKKNCQIVNDHALEQKYHSPLIRGFSQDAIVYYLTNLRTIDPWAAFQKTHYPHLPMQMSKVCPPDTIADKSFLNWLRDVGFTDTIVFELNRMSGYWTAINLFLQNGSGPEAQQAMGFANAHYALLRRSWQVSQNIVRDEQARAALFQLASTSGAPVCLVGANGEMIECNSRFNALIEKDVIRLSGSKRKLSFAKSVSVQGLDRWEQHEFLSHEAEMVPLFIQAKPIDPDPLFARKREQFWMLTCSNAGLRPISAPVSSELNLGALTVQQRDLYRGIEGGMSVVNAGVAIGLKRSRAFDVWAEVKAKLGITSAHKLRQ